MRLINTKTYLLESIYTQVPYAILSHTWGPEEISFQEWEVVHDSGAIQGQCPHTQKMSRPNVTRKKGYEKVIGACQQAARDGIKYLWCDTNCIDKTSSAELSEAINSMFAWYRDSKICYALLTDVKLPTTTSLRGYKSNVKGWFARQEDRKRLRVEVWDSFQDSRWWTRGWTLQELLAPKNLVFFASDWSPLESKRNLSKFIPIFTSIHPKALQDASSIPKFSIAQRMSWAADRRTTVPEDMAYCLLGIFDINMPMLYGQGHKAFLKLQEEIIKVSDDHSILAWDNPGSNLEATPGLANSPAAFRECGDVSRCEDFQQSSYSVTNLGISIRLELKKTTIPGVDLAGLNCCRALHPRGDQPSGPNYNSRKEYRIWIPLLIAGYHGDNRWLRSHDPISKTCLDAQFQMLGKSIPRDIFISTDSTFFSTTASVGSQIASSRLSPELSGFLVCIGFGDVDHIPSYLQLYDVPSFTMITLRQRRPCDISHLLVSSGLFSIVLSAVWDANGSHSVFRHSVIKLKASDFLAKTQSGNKWGVLHDQQMLSSGRVEDACMKLSTLHRDLTDSFPAEESHRNSKHGPFVRTFETPLQNFRGRSEILAKVIFREPSECH
ncbi:hypothetical protein PG995_013066 [Apiospora arundinis]